jgi:DNA-binding CsgD family transcriptional regulator
MAESPTETPFFIAGPPISQPGRFFGRARELRRIFNLLRRVPLQNAAVIGPRRSGKTSLLHYLRAIGAADPAQLRPDQKQDWLDRPEQYHWLFVDFQDARLGNPETLLRHLLTGLDLPIPAPCTLESFLDEVSGRIAQPTVILLDEIGVALQRYPALDNAFWESLRSLATNQANGRLAFVLAAHESPAELASAGGFGSPFFNIFGYAASLGPLAEEEARELLASSPIPFPPTDVEWMLERSGRWPYLLQILARERLLTLEEGDPSPAWRSEALAQIRRKDEGGRMKEEGVPQSSVLSPQSSLLSERELEVLRLLAAGHSNQEIANRLVVALSTVKTHVNNIYSKLEARNRTEAANRARELGLLS